MTVQELIDLLQRIPDKDSRQVITGGVCEGIGLAEQVVLEDVGGVGSKMSFEVLPCVWFSTYHQLRDSFLATPGVKVLAPNRPLKW